jgi:hypothetical protein
MKVRGEDWHMLYHITVLKLLVNTHTAKPSATGYARIKKKRHAQSKHTAILHCNVIS